MGKDISAIRTIMLFLSLTRMKCYPCKNGAKSKTRHLTGISTTLVIVGMNQTIQTAQIAPSIPSKEGIKANDKIDTFPFPETLVIAKFCNIHRNKMNKMKKEDEKDEITGLPSTRQEVLQNFRW